MSSNVMAVVCDRGFRVEDRCFAIGSHVEIDGELSCTLVGGSPCWAVVRPLDGRVGLHAFEWENVWPADDARASNVGPELERTDRYHEAMQAIELLAPVLSSTQILVVAEAPNMQEAARAMVDAVSEQLAEACGALWPEAVEALKQAA